MILGVCKNRMVIMDFVVIANAWSAGKDNPTSKHRIALELVRLGHRVLWIEGSGMRTPSVGSAHDRLRMVKKVVAALRGARRDVVESGRRKAESGKQKSPGCGELWVLSPLFIPLPRYDIVRRLNGMICVSCMKVWGWKLGFRDVVLINYVPVLAEAMRGSGRKRAVDGGRAEGDISRPEACGLKSGGSQRAPRVVYHCVDRWDAFSAYDAGLMAEMDRRCCEYADVVLASSQDLVDRCRRHNRNVRLLSHGVDHEHFSQALMATERPPDLPAGKVAGFFGLLSEWIDQDLLVEIARCVPDCALVLIGKADVNVDRLKGVQNIHLLGPRPFGRLPDYVAHFDVGLIPFVVNELTVAVNPIKLREMLAAGCPVVSTALPEVERCSPGLVAHSHQEFVALVRKTLNSPLTREERRSLSDSVRQETWSAKVAEILALVAGTCGERGDALTGGAC